MKNMTLENIASACSGRLYVPDAGRAAQKAGDTAQPTAEGVAVDSRLVQPGYIFVAAKGEKTDGHNYIPIAFDRGAMAVICEKLPEQPAGPCILVKDSLEALKKAAAFYRMQFDIPVIGITGSVGKTSTKEFIASVLSQHFNVLKTEGNFNNEVGLPLTVFRMNEEHEAAVLEMGINTFGEMHRLSEIARPDMVVMTNIGECHLEFLHDRDGVLRAKSEIFDFMDPNGTVFINADDDKLLTIKEVNGNRPVRFGFSSDYDVWADDVHSEGLLGSTARIHTPSGDFEARINLPGRHMVGNAMAAAAVGLQMGLTTEEISKGISSVLPVEGRSHLIHTDDIMIIDDCYNANPVSVKAAIDLLVSSGTRTVAILGDMFELGRDELKMHEDVGRYAALKGVDLLMCAGELSASMYEGAVKEAGESRALYFKTRDELIDAIPGNVRRGDTVLVKASHGMEYGAAVEALKEYRA